MTRQVYLAYGANTNMDSMAMRCPNAIPYGTMKLDHYELAFHGVADVRPKRNSRVFGAVWRITDMCEASLDRFEGYPRLYTKRYVTVRHEGHDCRVMFYVMVQPGPLQLPSRFYEDTLRVGYHDFDLPAEQIDLALLNAERHQLMAAG